MEYIKLINICTPKQWKTLSVKELDENGIYNVYGANGIIGKYNEYNHKNPALIIGCRGTCGAESVRITKPFSYINGNAMCFDNISSNFNIKFLFYFLKSLDYSKIITGVAQPQITGKSLLNIEVPYISLVKQKQIVSELDIIYNSIKDDEEIISKYDQLIKSRFMCQEVVAWTI